LARGCFALKTPDSGGWNSLDFLGFSRPNRDISMGYTGFSLKQFFAALFPLRAFEAPSSRIWRGQGINGSWREFSLLSDFLQSIVVGISPEAQPTGNSDLVKARPARTGFDPKRNSWLICLRTERDLRDRHLELAKRQSAHRLYVKQSSLLPSPHGIHQLRQYLSHTSYEL
jgi:hypothetical protein